jgi:hypothetical protein
MLASTLAQRTIGVEAMNKTIRGLAGFVALAALTASASAIAQQMTYDFTGTVTSSDFASVSAGMTITGTYTINLGNADLSSDGYSDNAINRFTPWLRGEASGAAYPDALVTGGTVFSSMLKAGSSTFNSPAPSAFGSLTYVEAGPFDYNAYNIEHSSSSWFTESSFNIANSNATVPYLSNGLPVFGASSLGTGSYMIATYVDNVARPYNFGPKLDYSITSFSPVAAPEIDPASAAGGLTLLFGAMAMLRGRRRVVA